jgi:hypothetical protein
LRHLGYFFGSMRLLLLIYTITNQQSTSAEKARRTSQPAGSSLRLIVGKSLHSPNRIPRIKPAIEGLLKHHPRVGEENYKFDGDNEGTLNVNIL